MWCFLQAATNTPARWSAESGQELLVFLHDLVVILSRVYYMLYSISAWLWLVGAQRIRTADELHQDLA